MQRAATYAWALVCGAIVLGCVTLGVLAQRDGNGVIVLWSAATAVTAVLCLPALVVRPLRQQRRDRQSRV